MSQDTKTSLIYLPEYHRPDAGSPREETLHIELEDESKSLAETHVPSQSGDVSHPLTKSEKQVKFDELEAQIKEMTIIEPDKKPKKHQSDKILVS